MQTLRPSQVPDYLRNTSFYLGLNVADDDEFAIPLYHMKQNMNVDTLVDMEELLNTIRFWGLEDFPQAMVDFSARQSYADIEPLLEPFHVDLPFLTSVCSIVSEVADSKERLEKAMESGDIDVVRYFHKHGVQFTARAIALAAGRGALDCLQYALSVTTPGYYSHSYSNSVYSEVVRNGLLDSIKILRQLGFPLQRPFYSFYSLYYSHLNNLGDYDNLPEIAASSGQLDVLKYLHSQGCSISSTAIAAANAGHMDCLEYALNEGALLRGEKLHEPKSPSLAQRLARAQQFKLFPLALARGDTVDAQTVLYVAKTERWEYLRILITHKCHLCKSLSTVLVYANQLELYHLAVAHGCEVSVQAACKFARDGNLPLLQHALDHGCERSEEILRAAAHHGKLPCLKYAHAQGCPWSAQVTLAAARGGHQECLQYLHELGCPCNAHVRSVKRKHGILG